MSSGRYIDLAISVRLADVELDDRGRPRWKSGTDEEILRVGGRWDRRKKRWSKRPAREVLVLRFHRGQEDSIRWFCRWLRAYVSNDWTGMARAWSALLIGGRRSGKTHVICAVFVVFAVLNPGALLWAISPTLETGDELDENFRALLPRRWYVRRQAKTGRATTFRIANGSRILLKSAVKPQRLKAGRVDLAFLNEAQELDRLAYVKVRAPIADRGGLVILAANPPDTPRGRWVEEHYAAAHAGRIQCELFELDPRNNPWINYEALASIGTEIDEKTYQRDVLGLFPPIGDVVMHAWSDRENVAYPPSRFVDVTAEFTRKKLGHAAGYVSSKDFQLDPHMAATIHKFYRDPDNPDPDDIYEFIVDEVIAEEANEDQLLDEIESTPRWRPGDGKPEERDHAEGYRGWREQDDDAEAPVHCAVVMDASAWWQDGQHNKGKQSDRKLRARRWSHLYRPRFETHPDGSPYRNNPDIIVRVNVCNARLKTNSGRRRLFVAPHCAFTRKAMRQWENSKVTGTPNRKSPFAHACDTVSYVTYRFFGKPKVSGQRSEYRGANRYDRAAELRDW